MSTRRLVALSLVACLAVAAPASAGAPPAPELSCEACIVVADDGRVLYARRARAALPNASTTKMTTALVVVETAAPGERVAVSPHAAATGGGGLDLHAGDSYTVRDLLYALLLSSSNDAAVALAEHVGGTERAFVSAMNDLADALGARATHYVTPHGLDAPGHVSSARDLVAVASALLDDPMLARIVRTQSHRLADGTVVENRNALLDSYTGAIGVKTGRTLGAGDVLVAAARRRGRTLIAVALRSVDAAADDRALLDYGFARLARTALVGRGEPIGVAPLAPSGAVPAVAGRAVRGLAPPAAVDVAFEAARPAPSVRAGERVGTVSVSYRGRTLGRVPAVAARAAAGAAPALLAGAFAVVVRALSTPWAGP
ncbi:MAG TPA: serine hydrolase [Actinomycetota bacterium]|nr:serine hydrolase [Actinomycetota bacterium]